MRYFFSINLVFYFITSRNNTLDDKSRSVRWTKEADKVARSAIIILLMNYEYPVNTSVQ